jgi:hypothetical protein
MNTLMIVIGTKKNKTALREATAPPTMAHALSRDVATLCSAHRRYLPAIRSTEQAFGYNGHFSLVQEVATSRELASFVEAPAVAPRNAVSIFFYRQNTSAL